MPVSLVTMPLRAPLLCALPPSPTFAADELPRCRTGADGRTLPAEFSDEALADPGRARARRLVRQGDADLGGGEGRRARASAISMSIWYASFSRASSTTRW